MDNKTKIIIATHKKYVLPKSNLYFPLHVGAYGKENLGYERDDTGDNISSLNPNFCELTGLYWAWKNLSYDKIGLVHYRRYFAGSEKLTIGNRTIKVLGEKDIKKLEKYDCILPKKRNYFIETLYSHYEHTMYVAPLDVAGQILREKYPEYYPEFKKLKKRRSAHMFNMFIMKKDLLDKYCTWLFDVLFELKNHVDETKYNSFHARFYGRVSELLLDVWINVNGIKYKEIRVVSSEKINWCKKISSFLKAKFKKEKYEKSF